MRTPMNAWNTTNVSISQSAVRHAMLLQRAVTQSASWIAGS